MDARLRTPDYELRGQASGMTEKTKYRSRYVSGFTIPTYVGTLSHRIFRVDLTPGVRHIKRAVKVIAMSGTSASAGEIMTAVVSSASLVPIMFPEILQYGIAPYLFNPVCKNIPEEKFTET